MRRRPVSVMSMSVEQRARGRATASGSGRASSLHAGRTAGSPQPSLRPGCRGGTRWAFRCPISGLVKTKSRAAEFGCGEIEIGGENDYITPRGKSRALDQLKHGFPLHTLAGVVRGTAEMGAKAKGDAIAMASQPTHPLDPPRRKYIRRSRMHPFRILTY